MNMIWIHVYKNPPFFRRKILSGLQYFAVKAMKYFFHRPELIFPNFKEPFFSIMFNYTIRNQIWEDIFGYNL